MPTERAVRALNRISENLTKGIERTIRAITDEISTRLVNDPGTPVDTGFARANWRPSLNAPISSALTSNDPSGDATVARIQVVARRYRVGDTLFIRNNAPYIIALDEGSSPQAEAGFVRTAIDEGFDAAISDLSDRGLGL